MEIAAIRIPIWLIIIYMLALATILIWPFIAFMSVFAFDAPGTAQDPAVWTGVIAILSYPLLPLVGVPGSFLAYRKGLRKPAYILAAIGAVPLVILAIALISIVVMNFLFLLGAKI